MTDTRIQTSSLDDIATDEGTFAVVAMDQRNTLKRMYAAVGVNDPSTEELVAIKADAVQALAPSASAFLLDPTYGIPALEQVADEVRASLGVLVAAEPPVREKYAEEPRGTRDAALDAAWVRSQGGDALKFLIQVRADRPRGDGPDLAAEAVEVIRQVVEDCRAAGVPSVIENLIYPLPGEELDADRRADAIIAAAVALDELRPGPAQAGVPRQPRGLPPARRLDLRAVGRALGRGRLRRVHPRAAGLLRRGRRVRLHRRPCGLEGDRRHGPRGTSRVPRATRAGGASTPASPPSRAGRGPGARSWGR